MWSDDQRVRHRSQGWTGQVVASCPSGVSVLPDGGVKPLWYQHDEFDQAGADQVAVRTR